MERTITRVQFPARLAQKKKVAAYARVSTGKDAMLHSLAAQVDYYSDLIRHTNRWEYIGVYTDEALTGTKNSRAGFQQMLTDCRAGKIDMIITKSISRFARNTVTLLETVRELKALGVDVFFEEEGIHSISSEGELMLTFLASYAQEESRSVSENCTWRIRERFGRGEPIWFRIYGYRMRNGRLEIHPEEAEVVRMIFSLYLDGFGCQAIANRLQSMGIPSVGGKVWHHTMIAYVITNEHYCGNLLLQKRFTVDFLTKKMKVNEGEVEQYYVRNSHDAIISPLEFDMVQAEIERRRKMGRSYSGNDLFASRLYCGDCGSLYGQKVWHSNDPYRLTVHRCNHKFGGEAKCMTPTLAPETVQKAFLEAYSRMLGGRETV
ncbi:MAG: recombinase family protein, partial [Ruminococcaceae bacterium]|nr:recombinase family protein [Oscillospiraceae bacterium]